MLVWQDLSWFFQRLTLLLLVRVLSIQLWLWWSSSCVGVGVVVVVVVVDDGDDEDTDKCYFAKSQSHESPQCLMVIRMKGLKNSLLIEEVSHGWWAKVVCSIQLPYPGKDYTTGQIIVTSYNLTSKKGSWGREMGPLISGKSRFAKYNIMIWPAYLVGPVSNSRLGVSSTCSRCSHRLNRFNFARLGGQAKSLPWRGMTLDVGHLKVLDAGWSWRATNL